MKAVLFDAYDTLIFIPGTQVPFLKMLKALGCTPEEVQRDFYRAVTGRYANMKEFLATHYPDATLDIAPFEAEDAAELATVQYFEETKEVLQTLKRKGIRLALVSNVNLPYKAAIERVGLPAYFDSATFSCDIGYAKADPETYLHALHSLGVSAEEAIMVGDLEKEDLIGPRAVGIQSYIINRKSTGAAGALTSLRQVLDLV